MTPASTVLDGFAQLFYPTKGSNCQGPAGAASRLLSCWRRFLSGSIYENAQEVFDFPRFV